ncbi:MAG: LodA/GoxA family CTQ-dependent oxidase [Verrucomicrobiae bacterium]|nr:LodA/GoxA family CTQ-dependent oxidase [Verrucomicrobiae bacterium]
MNRYRIYPPIAVARVGDAPCQYYIGPETYRGLPINPDGRPFTEKDFRDPDGRLCRQAARFRIFRDTDKGPEEVTLKTPDVHSIEWTVHVANKKASWYEFKTNAGEHGYASNHPLRNAHVTDRSSLIIDPGPRKISGAKAGPQAFDRKSVPPEYQGATFPPALLYQWPEETKENKDTKPVEHPPISIDTLGELRTDAEGRLIFLGGLGKAGSSRSVPAIAEYANNDDWWDDTSDGPLRAVVTLHDGTRIDAGTAWVIVAPPAYAPQIPNLVTLWDTIFDTAVRSGHHPAIWSGGFWCQGPEGYRPNFVTEIAPLIERATLYPWVAAIPPKAHRFDMTLLGQVPVPGQPDSAGGLRRWILGVLRPPSAENQIVGPAGRTMMPFLAGDNALNLDSLTSKYLRLTDTQYFFLQQWAEGWFVNEPDRTHAVDALTRAVLDNCVGGAFSPGIEMTWISRNPDIYQPDDPMRINAELPAEGPLRLTFDPAHMQPGDLSRYMAVPWQADFNECSSQPIDGRVLWWWPAQRPEYVYLDPTRPRPPHPMAVKAEPVPTETTGGQVAWVGTDFDQIRSDYISFADDLDMVRYWSGLGFVMKKEIPDPARAPSGKHDKDIRYVEVARTLPRPFFPK